MMKGKEYEDIHQKRREGGREAKRSQIWGLKRYGEKKEVREASVACVRDIRSQMEKGSSRGRF